MYFQQNMLERHQRLGNVCSAEKYTKHSSVLLLRLVYFSAEQTLVTRINTRDFTVYELECYF